MLKVGEKKRTVEGKSKRGKRRKKSSLEIKGKYWKREEREVCGGKPGERDNRKETKELLRGRQRMGLWKGKGRSLEEGGDRGKLRETS